MTKNTQIGLSITVVILFLIAGFAINRGYAYYIKNYKVTMYYYLENDKNNNSPNPALYITNLRYKDSIVTYYSKVLIGQNPVFNFPLKTLPQYDPVYLLDFTPDSLLAKVICYTNNKHVTKNLFVKGWVDARLLHVNAPPKRK